MHVHCQYLNIYPLQTHPIMRQWGQMTTPLPFIISEGQLPRNSEERWSGPPHSGVALFLFATGKQHQIKG